MEELPPALLDRVPLAHQAAVRDWWARLSDPERRQVAWLCDERWDSCFFGLLTVGETAPLVIGGRFLAHDDAWRAADWEEEWREYLVEHPGRYHGNGWPETAALIASQFHSTCLLSDDPGVGCRLGDWSLTRFAVRERPPSERGHR